MEGTPTTKSKTGIIIISVAAFIFICFLIGMGLYRMYFQFNAQDVRDYINDEANTFPPDKRLAVFKILKEGVDDILKDRELCSQVLAVAKMNGTPPEMEIVHASIMRSRAFGYLVKNN